MRSPTTTPSRPKIEKAEVSRRGTLPLWVDAIIVLLAMIAFVAVIVAIAIPGRLSAVQGGRQMHSVRDMRSIGLAMEAHARDHGSYPVTDDIDELASFLEPRYLESMQRSDAWGRPFRVLADGRRYAIQSAGADGVFEDDPTAGALRDFNADIAYANGRFTQGPEGELDR